MKLYVVRHARPLVAPEVPPERWSLSPEGRTDARGLAEAHDWRGVGRVWHSPQPKTAQTAEIIAGLLGVPALSEPALAEVTMDAGFLPAAVFEERVGAYLEGRAPEDPAFEPYARAEARIVGGVRGILARSAPAPATAIVSHGRMLMILLGALCGARLGREVWRSLRLPDLAVLDLAAGRVESGFCAGSRIDPRVVLP